MPFSEVIKGDQPVLIDFYADWCGPCKAMAPILEEVAGKVKGKASIVKINVDYNPAIAEHFGIRGIPTFMVFKKGEVKWRQAGMQSAEQLESVLLDLAEEK
ncbi:MAG: thioredoxin [Bacteroidetes bacterium]|nr:MAG: thioredoxin [Bacteroidota bacterium]